VRALKAGVAREYYDNVTFSKDATTFHVAAPQDVTDIDFHLNEGASISGYVYNDETGEPLQGAGMRIIPSSDETDAGFNAATDANGFYEIECLALGIYKVNANANGFVQRWYEQRYSPDRATDLKTTPPDNLSNINFSLYRGGSISGTVVDNNGMPIEGVYVNAGDQLPDGDWIGGGTTTQSDGNYTINDLLAWDQYEVTAQKSGFVPAWYDSKSTQTTADRVRVADGNDTPGINFTLQAAGAITGHVYDEEDGTPVRGVDISVDFPTGERFGIWGGTDRDGSYTLWLGPGDYLISTGGRGYVGEWYDNHFVPENATIVNVTASNETSGVDFHLSKAGSISGHVYNEQGEAIGDATVYAASNESPGNGTNSESDGSYVIEGLLIGDYTVQVSVTGYTSESKHDIVVNATNNTPGIDFTLKKVPPPDVDANDLGSVREPNDL
jgi:hypothetical protein